MLTAEPALEEVFLLGEGPLWDAARERLLWVDILAGDVLVGALEHGRVRVVSREHVDDFVGCVAIAADGSLALAARDRIVILRPDGNRVDGPLLIPAGEARRLNDGAADPAGRLLVGTLSLAGPSSREQLVRVEHDGGITIVDDDLTLSNGLAWSADGRTLFSADSRRRTVFRRDYDPDGTTVGKRKVFVTLADALPDGIAMDAAGHLWVAAWSAGQLRRFSPEGRLTDVIDFPAPHVTNAAFAGEDLRTLVVTTGSAELDPTERAAFPDSGRLFTVRMDVPGLPLAVWQPVAANLHGSEGAAP